VIRFNNNSIQGSLPTSLSTATMLVELDFSFNVLKTISDTFENLPGLQILALQDNDIEQTIPASIGLLKSVRTLSLQNNKFNGDIPSSFGLLISAEAIDLSGNTLGGTVPNTIGAGMTKLKSLKLGDENQPGNVMTGTIPSELFQMPMATSLNLWGNTFSGHFPATYCTISGEFEVIMSTSSVFWCPFPCFDFPSHVQCQNCGSDIVQLGFTHQCAGDDDKCMTCANHGECDFNNSETQEKTAKKVVVTTHNNSSRL
jgi:hypothetical protein